jgi:hypothetical protein
MTAHLLLALALPLAQAARPPASGAPFYLLFPSVSYGAPLRTAASFAVFRSNPNPKQEQQIEGWLVEAGIGQGGARISAGHAGFLEYFGLDVRGVLTRTFASPRKATPRATYAGVEGGMTIAYVRLAAGFAHRLTGSGERATIFTWSGAVQIPIK